MHPRCLNPLLNKLVFLYISLISDHVEKRSTHIESFTKITEKKETKERN